MLYAQAFGRLDHVLLREAKAFARAEWAAKGALLAHLAVIDERRLYVAAGHSSMYDYCARELGLSEDASIRRLNAARIARTYPVLFDALADGRIHLTTILVLATFLNASNATELVEGAAHKTMSELRDWLARRFPRPALPTRITEHPGSGSAVAPTASARLFEADRDGRPADSPAPARPVPTDSPAPIEVVVPLVPRARVEPRSADCVAYQFSVARRTHDKLRRVQELLGPALAVNDLAGVFDRALDVLLEKLEKRRFAATSKPRAPQVAPSLPAVGQRHIAAHVRRAVWQRDNGQCTFVSPSGRRCECRRGIEFDHITPVARGGGSTVANLRLRCRAHNQYEAERVFGEGFMRDKRDSAKGQRTAGGMNTRAKAGCADANRPDSPAPARPVPLANTSSKQLEGTA